MVARKWQQRPAREAGAPLSTECTPGAGSGRQTRRQGIPGPSRGADGPPGLHEHPTCPQGTPAAEGCFPAGPQGPHLGDTWHLWSHVCPGGPPARAHRLRDKASVAWPLCGCSGGRASPLSAAGLQSGLSGLSQLGPSDSCRASSQPLQERAARDGQFPAQHTATDPSLHLSPAETRKLQLWWQAIQVLVPCCKTTSGSVTRARDPTSPQGSFPILKMGAAPLSF